MDLIVGVKILDNGVLFKPRIHSLPIPELGAPPYTNLLPFKPKLFGFETLPPRESQATHIKTVDTPQWQKFTTELVLESVGGPDPGVVLVLDCSYKWGRKNPHSLLLAAQRHLKSASNTHIPSLSAETAQNQENIQIPNDLIDLVVVIDGLDDITTLQHYLTNITSLPQLQKFQNYPLKAVIIQDLSIFHWKLKDTRKIDMYIPVYRACDRIFKDYGCPVFTSNWEF